MTINSKRKGKVGEAEVAKILRSHGYDEARRSQQYCGSADSADVVGLPGYHIEVKRAERMELYKWYAQAVRDSSGSEDIPIVVHRKNNADWLVSMSFEDFLRIVKDTTS